MPLLTLHLLRLAPDVSKIRLLEQLHKGQKAVEIIVASQPRHYVARAQKDSPSLSSTTWDLMLLLRTPNGDIPSSVKQSIVQEYKIFVGVPSKLLAAYSEKNKTLLKDARSVPLTGSLENNPLPESSQNLEASPELLKFMDELMKEHDGPVTMLNLLHFKKGGKPHYYQYGQRFMKIGGKRGGNAKIVGNVVPPPPDQSDSRGNDALLDSDWWNEIAIVHYPSIKHFCDMAAGKDYQAINDEYRLPALADTLLLCTTEIDLSSMNSKAKL